MNGAASLAPGTGRVQLTGYATLDKIGASLDYEQRFRSRLATFANAWAGANNIDGWRPDAGIQAGLRYTW